MAEHLTEVSIVIPLAPGDSADGLKKQLQNSDAEIIIMSEGTRAKSLNTGAAQAGRKFLWFLHVDTVLPENAIAALEKSLQEHEGHLHYFGLKFSEGGPALMGLNAFGANLRSLLFGAPFGDQGLCVRKDLFFKTGGYPENAAYGEDHLFVWHAKRHGIKLACVPATLETSARAYKEKGWFGLTLKRQYLWIRQALPQWWKLVRGK